MIILLRIDGQINSRDLWSHIEHFKVNLTDLIEFTYVYGEVELEDAVQIIRICALYGNLSVELFKGGQ